MVKGVNTAKSNAQRIKVGDFGSEIQIELENTERQFVDGIEWVRVFSKDSIDEKKYIDIPNYDVIAGRLYMSLPPIPKGNYNIEIMDNVGRIYPVDGSLKLEVIESTKGLIETYFIDYRESILQEAIPMVKEYLSNNPEQFKGDKGDQGEQGIQGEKGDKGEDGYTPIKGVDYFDGVDGKDFVFSDFTTEQLEDLKLKVVDTELDSEGNTLVTFTDGSEITVNRGLQGKSAYEIAVENGFDGAEQEWIDRVLGVVIPDDIYGTAGSKFIVSGDAINGFYGVVPAHQMGELETPEGKKELNSSNLALAVGLSQGTPQFEGTPWLKFSRNGKILFVPQKPIRHSVSWNALYQAGAVYGTGETVSDGEQFMLENDTNYGEEARVPQGARVKIGGHEYIVRLMKVGGSDPLEYGNSDRGSSGEENEWNNLILPLHESAPSSFTYNSYADIPRPDWGVGFTDEDLLTHHTFGTGNYQWGQETSGVAHTDGNHSLRSVRGYGGASNLSANSSWNTLTIRGWRPVLELL